VPIHIAGTPHRELDDTKRLGRETLLRPGVGPGTWHHERDVSTHSCEGAFAAAVLRIPPAVVDA
jgi:hypothetical protein